MVKKIQLLLMLTISTATYSAGKINFNEQKKIEEVKKTEKIEKAQVTPTSQKNLNNEARIRNNIVEFAKKQIGKPYLWGASGNQKFDCSSFTQYVYSSVGINIPRVSYDQAQFKPRLSSGIKPGDLLFFETLGKGRISHVGIYIGNRKFIHASSKYKRVTISDFSGFYADTFRWAGSAL